MEPGERIYSGFWERSRDNNTTKEQRLKFFLEGLGELPKKNIGEKSKMSSQILKRG